ncbi:curli-like amyloid fiber formation chaperone CsgH [Rhizobium helianthi]|uniref:Curli-like amyloid fiber formation chaperone CsgH n=1 Tax=Rhizobium helianthi TaxID=1132695 RepID=A0ABW4M027_9HYPH
MFTHMNVKSTVALTLLIAAAGSTTGLALAAGSAKGPLRCELKVTNTGGMTMLQAFVVSDREVDGTYRLKVDGSGQGGTSTIQQGGPFSASSAKPTSLGSVSLGSGSAYDARLDITAGGKSVKCLETVAPRI